MYNCANLTGDQKHPKQSNLLTNARDDKISGERESGRVDAAKATW